MSETASEKPPAATEGDQNSTPVLKFSLSEDAQERKALKTLVYYLLGDLVDDAADNENGSGEVEVTEGRYDDLPTMREIGGDRLVTALEDLVAQVAPQLRALFPTNPVETSEDGNVASKDSGDGDGGSKAPGE